MQIDIDIEPSELSRDELSRCVKYAADNFPEMAFLDGIDCDLEKFQELLRELYEYFAKQSSPAPQPVRDFFWRVYGKLV